VDLHYHQLRSNDNDDGKADLELALTDIGKSYERSTVRHDGWAPAMTTNSKVFDFVSGDLLQGYHLLALRGFNVAQLKWAGISTPGFWPLLAGNAMAVPVVDAAIFSVSKPSLTGLGLETINRRLLKGFYNGFVFYQKCF
jgi:hypothetical protein